jgi:glycosyltransferase involved in cell wall biosynthesis
MDHKVSIIVPVYGVEKYIGACIESLIAQTYRNLEILLVDDGGKDKSGEICDRYAAQDDRIRVIHKPNGGAASARNAGLDAATGDFVCFVDGDDAVRPDYVKQLLTYVTDRNADIAVCGFCNWCRSGTKQVECHNTGEYTGQEYLLRFLRDWSCSLLWNKIYRREVIGDIRMKEGHKVDDEFFTYQVVMNCSKVVLFETPLYDYRLRNSSAMQDMSPYLERIMLDRVVYITARYQNIANRMPQIEPDYFLDTLDTITRYWYHSKNMPEAQKQIRRWVRTHTLKILSMKLPLRKRMGNLYQLYLKRPKVMSEPNPICLDADEYFA